MHILVAVDPGKTCGVCIAYTYDKHVYTIYNAYTVVCQSMNKPNEAIKSIYKHLRELKQQTRQTSSVCITIERQFWHAPSIRCEAWLTGAAASMVRTLFADGVEIDVRTVQGKLRLKTPERILHKSDPERKPIDALDRCKTLSKAARRQRVKAYAKALLNAIVHQSRVLRFHHPDTRSYLLDPKPSARNHDAIDAMLQLVQMVNAQWEPFGPDPPVFSCPPVPHLK